MAPYFIGIHQSFQISLVTDRLGSIIAYDILSKTSVPEETLSLGDNTLLDIDAVRDVGNGVVRRSGYREWLEVVVRKWLDGVVRESGYRVWLEVVIMMRVMKWEESGYELIYYVLLKSVTLGR